MGEGQVKRRLSLRLQVIVAMAIVLSPLLIMGAIQTWTTHSNARQLRFLELQQGGQERVREVEAILSRARTALRMVSADERGLTCSEVGQKLMPLDLPLRNTMRFDVDGLVTCHEIGEALTGVPMPVPEWNDLLRRGAETIEAGDQLGLALGEPAIYMLRRQSDSSGSYAGSLAITLSIEDIINRLSSSAQTTAFVSADGSVIGSGIVRNIPAEWLTESALLGHEIRRLVTSEGRALDIVVMPVSTNGIWMIAGEPAGTRQTEAVLVFLVPILAYLAALLAASWIADAMVLRWLRRVRLRITDMRSSGAYMPLIHEVARAPSEIQQLARAFDDLTGQVTRHESELQGALAQMRAAFREIHHRVKNNLQIMFSMLKLQGRGETSPETQAALRLAARRVAMMAAVHHALLNEGDLDTVDALDLFNVISNQIDEQQGWSENGRRLIPDITPGALPSDLAVPIGMFVLEAVCLLCPEVHDGRNADMELRFIRADGQAKLSLFCLNQKAGGDNLDMDRETNLFLSAFARQLNGSVRVDTEVEGRIGIELTFLINDDEDVA